MIGPERVVAEHMRERRRTGITWLAVALVLAATLGTAYRIDHRADHSDAQVHKLQGQVDTNGQLAQDAMSAAREANLRLAAAGKPTVPVPTVAPVTPSPDELSVQDVRMIVSAELAQQKVTITQAEITQIARVAAQMVPKPADGKTPTVAQIQPVVAAAVAAYCTGDKCVGKTGTSGKDGRDGADGKDAPKVTDAELLKAAQQALAAYCAGETSPCDGRDGTNGQDAPIVVDVDCEGPADLKFTFNFDRNHAPITATCKPE